MIKLSTNKTERLTTLVFFLAKKPIKHSKLWTIYRNNYTGILDPAITKKVKRDLDFLRNSKYYSLNENFVDDDIMYSLTLRKT
jgi:hypothetical protein